MVKNDVASKCLGLGLGGFSLEGVVKEFVGRNERDDEIGQVAVLAKGIHEDGRGLALQEKVDDDFL